MFCTKILYVAEPLELLGQFVDVFTFSEYRMTPDVLGGILVSNRASYDPSDLGQACSWHVILSDSRFAGRGRMNDDLHWILLASPRDVSTSTSVSPSPPLELDSLP